jgi:hypothetical protein
MDKVDRGLAACHRVREQTELICLEFSGGKDSVALWLRCREIFPRIIPVYHYWVPGLKFVERTLAMYEDYFQTEIIRAPHPNWINLLANGSFQPPHRWNVIEEWSLGTVDYDEIVDWVMEDLGYSDYWVAVGIKASDSPIRQKAISTHGAWTPDKRLFYPVADLDKAGLIALLEQHQCPLSDDYKIFGRSFDGLQYRYLCKIKEHYPEDYQTILAWFPLVEAEFMRAQAYVTQKSQRPG